MRLKKINQISRLRESSRKLKDYFSSNPWSLQMKDRHLINRSNGFFSRANEDTLKAWIRRINEAVEDRRLLEKNGRYDIRNWLNECRNTIMPRNVKQSGDDTNQETSEEYSENMTLLDNVLRRRNSDMDNSVQHVEDVNVENIEVSDVVNKHDQRYIEGSMTTFIREYVSKFRYVHVTSNTIDDEQRRRLRDDENSENMWIIREHSVNDDLMKNKKLCGIGNSRKTKN